MKDSISVEAMEVVRGGLEIRGYGGEMLGKLPRSILKDKHLTSEAIEKMLLLM